MAKKQEEKTEDTVAAVPKISKIEAPFSNGDLDALRVKVNEVIDRLNA